VTGEATRCPRAGRGNPRWRCKRPEGGARRGHHWQLQWRLGVGARCVGRRRGAFVAGQR
jgi:hypothetical protein